MLRLDGAVEEDPTRKNPPFPAGSKERTTGIEPATLSLGS